MKNPEAAEIYVVWKQEKDKEWERVRETRKTRMLITGLKSDTGYRFKVTATNDLIKSIEETSWNTQTKSSKVVEGTSGGLVGAFTSSMMVVCLIEAVRGKEMSKSSAMVVSAATIPVSIVCAPVAAPVMAVKWGREAINKEYIGDLSPESDEETS